MVLLNTEKGKQLFNSIKDTIHYIESTTAECIQPNLQHPTQIPANCDEFVRDWQTHDFEYIIRKYGDPSLKGKLRHRKDIITRKLKLILNGKKR
ncbi:hypothetical protein FACS1894147_11040 [Spirochaetia bacterium]|nr:hypothetical protein FACS1894147_11040 [Spirochaetia bacterium]